MGLVIGAGTPHCSIMTFFSHVIFFVMVLYEGVPIGCDALPNADEAFFFFTKVIFPGLTNRGVT